MSFGFSVGDIILCTQIAYRLFSSVTDGRKKIPDDLKGLTGTLFCLYCALNHLERDHKIILVNASTNNTGDNPGQVRVQLDYVIKSCRETLEERPIGPQPADPAGHLPEEGNPSSQKTEPPS